MIWLAATWAILAVVSAPIFQLRYVTHGAGAGLLAAYCLAFVLGSIVIYVGADGPRLRSLTSESDLNYPLLFWIISGLATLGVSMRLLDHFVLNPHVIDLANLSQSKVDAAAAAARGEALETSAVTLFAGPLTGFCFFPSLILMRDPAGSGLLRKAIAAALVIFPGIDTVVFRGGSSALAYTLIFLASSWSMSVRRGSATGFSRRVSATIAIGGALTVLLGSTLFAHRVAAMAGDVGTYLSLSAYEGNSALVPSAFGVQLANTPGLSGPFMIFYWFFLYITSGVYNFMFVVETFSAAHTWGSTQAELVSRAISIARGGQDTLSTFANPLPGLYQTAFSNVFIDFGVGGGLIQSFLMGMGAAWVHASRLRGRVLGIFVDPVTKTFLILSILVSSFSGAGMFYLIAGFGVVVIALVTPRLVSGAHPAAITRLAPQR